MNIDTLILNNKRYKKIIGELDEIITNIILEKKNRNKYYIFFNPTGYFICFSYLTKPYIITSSLFHFHKY